MEVHVWELLKSKNLHIVVDITKSLKDNIKNIVSNDVKLYASKLDIQPARLYEYFIWQKSAIPLEMLFSLSDMLKLNKDFVDLTNKRLIDILSPTDKTIDSLTHLELPAGVDVEIKM